MTLDELRKQLDALSVPGDTPVILGKDSAQIAPRLREVVNALWPDEGDYDRKNGLALAEGMERAAAAGECLEFC